MTRRSAAGLAVRRRVVMGLCAAVLVEACAVEESAPHVEMDRPRAAVVAMGCGGGWGGVEGLAVRRRLVMLMGLCAAVLVEPHAVEDSAPHEEVDRPRAAVAVRRCGVVARAAVATVARAAVAAVARPRAAVVARAAVATVSLCSVVSVHGAMGTQQPSSYVSLSRQTPRTPSSKRASCV